MQLGEVQPCPRLWHILGSNQLLLDQAHLDGQLLGVIGYFSVETVASGPSLHRILVRIRDYAAENGGERPAALRSRRPARGYAIGMEPMLRTREGPEDRAPDHPHSTGGAEHSTWAQQSLQMRTWISVIAVLLCAFVTVLFLRSDALPEAVAFSVIGLMSLGYLGWTLAAKRRGIMR
jgi:hypothetical protein